MKYYGINPYQSIITPKRFSFKTLYSFILPQISNLSNHFYVIYEIGLDNAVVIRFHKYTLLSSI